MERELACLLPCQPEALGERSQGFSPGPRLQTRNPAEHTGSIRVLAAVNPTPGRAETELTPMSTEALPSPWGLRLLVVTRCPLASSHQTRTRGGDLIPPNTRTSREDVTGLGRRLKVSAQCCDLHRKEGAGSASGLCSWECAACETGRTEWEIRACP